MCVVAVLRTPQPYINALTMFTLETRETMVKMLPEVLLDLSKISDTKAIASPMLEFLSSKIPLLILLIIHGSARHTRGSKLAGMAIAVYMHHCPQR